MVAVAFALVACALLIFHSFARPTSGSPRVLLVGLDGADWRILSPLLDAGELPHLQSLIENGASGPLESIEPLISPPIWTSVATGVKPERHGITWFLADTDDPGKRVPVTSSLRRVKAIWNVLSERGRRVGVVGWWATYPAERVRGFVVSDFVGFHGFGHTGQGIDLSLGKTYPASLYGEIEPLLPAPRKISYEMARRFLDVSEEEFAAVGRGEGRWAEPIGLFCEYLATAECYVESAERLVPRFRPEAVLVYFELIDAACHLFARFGAPRMLSVGEEGWVRFSRTIEEVYRFQDERIGRLLRVVGEDCAVFVVSDHGFRWAERRLEEGDDVSVDRAHLWHEKEGVLIAAGPHLRDRRDVRGASVLDVTPTLLRYLGLPIAKDMDGTPLVELFEDGWLESNPAAWVDSYEAGGSPPDAPNREDWGHVAAGVADEQVRRLQALGYLSKDGGSAEVRKGRAQLLVREGRWEEACPELEGVVRLAPADPQARALLGEAYRRTQRPQLAQREYQVAASLAPNDPVLLCALGEIALEQGRVQEAEAWFWVAIDKGGESAPVRINLGHTLNLLHRSEEAKAQFEQALALDPNSHAALYNLGVLEERAGELALAEMYYRRAIEAKPGDHNAPMNLGVLLARRGRTQEAVRHLSKAKELSPADAQVCYNLGTVLLAAGMHRSAAEVLEESTRANPASPAAHLNLGHAFVGAGELSKAFKAYRIAARLAPGDPEARYSLAVAHAMAGNRKDSERELGEAIRLGGAPYALRAQEEPSLAGLRIAGRDTQAGR